MPVFSRSPSFGVHQIGASSPHPDPPDANEAKDEDEPPPSSDKDKPKKKRKRRSRTVVGADVERLFKDVTVPADERVCACCHHEMAVIDHIERRWLEFVPAKFIEHVERLAFGSQSVAFAHQSVALVSKCIKARQDRGRAGVALQHLRYSAARIRCRRRRALCPLLLARASRFAGSAARHRSRILLARASRERRGWRGAGGDRCGRACDAARGDRRPRRFGGANATALHRWSTNRCCRADLIDSFIQCDDYKGYGSIVTLPDGTARVLVDPDRRLGCMMHVRRRFYSALQLGDKRAAHAIEWDRRAV